MHSGFLQPLCFAVTCQENSKTFTTGQLLLYRKYLYKEKLITIARVSGEHVPDFESLMILINAWMLDVARKMN